MCSSDLNLTSGSNTFFRQENGDSDSFLIEFGTEGFNNGLGSYIQIYIPTDSGIYRVESVDPINYNEWTNIEIVYSQDSGATLKVNGVDVELISYSADGTDGVVTTVSDDNYSIGDHDSEVFNGEVSNLSITTLSDNVEVYSYSTEPDTFVEDESGSVSIIGSEISITDVDDTNIESATVVDRKSVV